MLLTEAQRAVQQAGRDFALERTGPQTRAFEAAALKDADQPCLKEPGMAELFASDTAEQVVSGAAGGVSILVTRLAALSRRGLKRGVSALSVGGGEATADAIERP